MVNNGHKAIFEYLDEMKAELKSDIQAVREDVRALQTSVDGLAKLVQDFRDEHLVLFRKVEILENWAKKVADKTGVPLPL